MIIDVIWTFNYVTRCYRASKNKENWLKSLFFPPPIRFSLYFPYHGIRSRPFHDYYLKRVCKLSGTLVIISFPLITLEWHFDKVKFFFFSFLTYAESKLYEAYEALFGEKWLSLRTWSTGSLPAVVSTSPSCSFITAVVLLSSLWINF